MFISVVMLLCVKESLVVFSSLLFSKGMLVDDEVSVDASPYESNSHHDTVDEQVATDSLYDYEFDVENEQLADWESVHSV